MSPPGAIDSALLQALEVKRDLTAHTAECAMRQKRLEEILGEIRDSQKETGGRLRMIEDKMTEAEGGWKVIAAAGAIGGAIMAGAVKALPYLGTLIR